MRLTRKILAVAVLAGLLAAVPRFASAGPAFQDSSTGRQVALSIGSGLTSVVYSPVKLCYAAGTTLTGGLVLAFTGGQDADTAARIVRRGTTGDWWVHPDVFTGHRRLHFNGPG